MCTMVMYNSENLVIKALKRIINIKSNQIKKKTEKEK